MVLRSDINGCVPATGALSIRSRRRNFLLSSLSPFDAPFNTGVYVDQFRAAIAVAEVGRMLTGFEWEDLDRLNCRVVLASRYGEGVVAGLQWNVVQDVMWLRAMHTRTDLQGRGIARAMISLAVHDAIRSAPSIAEIKAGIRVLPTDQENVASRRTFEGLAFVAEDKIGQTFLDASNPRHRHLFDSAEYDSEGRALIRWRLLHAKFNVLQCTRQFLEGWCEPGDQPVLEP